MARGEDIVRLSVQESSQLPPDLWDDPRCQLEYNALVQLLLDPKMLELFAIHEAGHEIYYRKAGCTAFIFESPRVIYNEKNTSLLVIIRPR